MARPVWESACGGGSSARNGTALGATGFQIDFGVLSGPPDASSTNQARSWRNSLSSGGWSACGFQRPAPGNWRICPGQRRSVKIAGRGRCGRSADRHQATGKRYFAISVAPRQVSVPAHAQSAVCAFTSQVVPACPRPVPKHLATTRDLRAD